MPLIQIFVQVNNQLVLILGDGTGGSLLLHQLMEVLVTNGKAQLMDELIFLI